MKIVTDGSVDMPEGWEQTYDINVVPIPIQIGARSFLQGVNLSSEEFYRMVRETRLIPKTSLPSTGQLVEFYRRVARPGETVLSIHVSSKMSGTFNAALAATRELADKYKIFPFDSLCGSAAIAFMCREARLLDQAGASLQDVLDRLDFIRNQVMIALTLDTLEFARMSGRVSALKAALASILDVKPVVVLREGVLDMSERVRTRRRAVDRIIELARQKAGEKLVNVAVVHSCDPQLAQLISEKIQSVLRVQEIILTELSIAVAANLGPGTVGVVVYPVEPG